jgi:hypothetical protein
VALPPILVRDRNARVGPKNKEAAMGLILIIVLVLLLLGAAPAWPYSRNWGYYPSGTITLILVIVLILVLLGRI